MATGKTPYILVDNNGRLCDPFLVACDKRRKRHYGYP